jgi:hypothetical protein
VLSWVSLYWYFPSSDIFKLLRQVWPQGCTYLHQIHQAIPCSVQLTWRLI